MGKVMRHGHFTSVVDLEDKLRMFLKYVHDTLAHPLHWTYTGKPTTPQRRHSFQPPHRRQLWHSKTTLVKLAL